jgi:murein tripeptide amidase MpaA
MINADGVYYGNYRTNLSGNDLNRVWKQPRKDFHPEIYWTKKYLHTVNKITELKLIVDIHGHSSALNSFFYGNPHKK